MANGGEPFSIRDATAADAAACVRIYTPSITDGIASFEEEPPGAEEMARRIGAAWAWLVAEAGGTVAGFAYGARHRDRAAYRFAADVSVYVDAAWHGRGVGRSLYGALFPRLRACGIWTLCAGIAEPNPASTALHRSVGFEPVGTYRRIGWKAGGWRDVTWYQLALHEGAEPPDEPRRAA